jgi:hypothetical protein
MSKTKHTPEPWSVEVGCKLLEGHVYTAVIPQNDQWLDENTPPYPIIALIPHRADENNALPDSRLANAKLIRSAPYLLQALEDIITTIGPFHQTEAALRIKRIAEAATAKVIES